MKYIGHVSQALLSHYENGTREPGLPFVCRVCDYFGVSADYILGRTEENCDGVCGTGAIGEMNKLLLSISDPMAQAWNIALHSRGGPGSIITLTPPETKAQPGAVPHSLWNTVQPEGR